MKRLFYFLVTTVFLFSCNDKDEIETPAPQEVNKYKTGKDLSNSSSISYVNHWSELKYNALGFGYDITGKYAHPAWIKKQIIDMDKIDDNKYSFLERRPAFSSYGFGTYTGTKQEVRSQLLTKMGIPKAEAKKFKNALSAMFNDPFKNDTTFLDKTYYYAFNANVRTWYEYTFYVSSPNYLIPYLTEEFLAALKKLPAEEIIKTYGTHIILEFEAGFKMIFFLEQLPTTI